MVKLTKEIKWYAIGGGIDFDLKINLKSKSITKRNSALMCLDIPKKDGKELGLSWSDKYGYFKYLPVILDGSAVFHQKIKSVGSVLEFRIGFVLAAGEEDISIFSHKLNGAELLVDKELSSLELLSSINSYNIIIILRD